MNAWQRILEAATPDCIALRAACRDPQRQQEDWLHRMLQSAQNTQFGREHHFARLRSVADYREAVPIRSYAEISPWIGHMIEGDHAVLTADEVVAFEETGGSSVGAKLIPYTEKSLAGFRAAVLPWLANLSARRPKICAAPAYVAVSPRLRPARVLPCGLSVGLPSEAAYLGSDLHVALAELLVTPSAALDSDADKWRTGTLAALIAREDLAFISIYSPTFLLELIHALPRLAGAIAQALQGVGCVSGVARMERALSGSMTDTQRLWPNLDTIATWTEGASNGYARRLAECFPHTHIDSRGVLSTESAITIRIDELDGCVPALTSAFIEFIDHNGDPHSAHELALFETYRIVLTTPGGLYRYDIQDEFQCVGFYDATPRLRFLGRAGIASDLVGEKLTDAFVAHSLGSLQLPLFLAPAHEPEPHYELWVDACISHDMDPLAPRVDDLLKANPQYDYARATGQLGPIRVIRHQGLMQHRHEVLTTQGVRMGDLKVTNLILDRSTLPPLI